MVYLCFWLFDWLSKSDKLQTSYDVYRIIVSPLILVMRVQFCAGHPGTEVLGPESSSRASTQRAPCPTPHRSFAGEALERERFQTHVSQSFTAGLGFANAKVRLAILA